MMLHELILCTFFSVKLERNWSLTKEEIATYWKSKKNKEEVHSVLKKTCTFSDTDQVWYIGR